jgi:hypothetical protein
MDQFSNKTFLDDMMLFYRDFYKETLAGNETTRRLFINGMVSGAVNRFETRMQQDKGNVDESKVLKFYFYSDHDDSTIEMSTAFNHTLNTYPPFASQIIFELWKNVST